MNLKDYLHLYIGAGYRRKWLPYTIREKKYRKKIATITHSSLYGLYKELDKPQYWEIKIILRPLSSITQEEYEIWDGQFSGEPLTGTSVLIGQEAARTNYLHQKGFDLYGLIPAGLAIDATSLDPTPHL